jgi:hypothetical protein
MQYLTTTKIPRLLLHKNGTHLTYNWENTLPEFSMPVDITVQGKTTRIYPTVTEQRLTIDNTTTLQDIEVATKHFYIKVSKKE